MTGQLRNNPNKVPTNVGRLPFSQSEPVATDIQKTMNVRHLRSGLCNSIMQPCSFPLKIGEDSESRPCALIQLKNPNIILRFTILQ